MTTRAPFAALWSGLVGLCLCLSLSGNASAQDARWQGLVVGQSGAASPKAFADAFHVADALRSGGLDVVQMLRDQPAETVFDAIEALAGTERAIVYFSGPLLADGTGLRLEGGDLGFDDVLARLGAAGLSEVALLVESCPSQNAALVLPPPPTDLRVLRAASMAPGAPCPAEGGRLTDLLRALVATEKSLGDLLSDVWVSSDLLTQPRMRPAKAPTKPAVSLVQNDVVSLVPVSAAAVSTTLAPLDLRATAASGAGEVVIFAPSAPAQLAALPTEAGLPEPSIIVGLIEQATLASFAPAQTPGEVTRNEISYENLEARRALKAQDAALFATLVEGGAFDPPTGELPTALQTELARMGCYTARIDGDWGPGSRRSVQRYFSELAKGPQSLDDRLQLYQAIANNPNATFGEGLPVAVDASVPLFRQIVMRDDIVCEVVAAAPAPRATTTRRTTRAAQPRTNTQRTTRQPAARSQPQQAPKRTLSNTNRLGVFR
ncbi:MAG: peptidoglycan-binding protein [Sulfitobacter sp.]